MLDRLGILLALGSLWALTGCGYSCEDFCEDGAECPRSETNADDCDASCERSDMTWQSICRVRCGRR